MQCTPSSAREHRVGCTSTPDSSSTTWTRTQGNKSAVASATVPSGPGHPARSAHHNRASHSNTHGCTFTTPHLAYACTPALAPKTPMPWAGGVCTLHRHTRVCTQAQRCTHTHRCSHARSESQAQTHVYAPLRWHPRPPCPGPEVCAPCIPTHGCAPMPGDSHTCTEAHTRACTHGHARTKLLRRKH
jgi:hypothetical protein